MSPQTDLLSKELISLFDLKKARLRDEKVLTQAAFEAQRDIRYLTLMFCDGIPTVSMQVSDSEIIKWDCRANALIYIKDGHPQILEAAPREIRVKMRPFLSDLVRKAHEFYRET